MRAETIGYLLSLGGWLLAAILGALRGWKAYVDRTEAEKARAAAEVRGAEAQLALASAITDHASALRGAPISTRSFPPKRPR